MSRIVALLVLAAMLAGCAACQPTPPPPVTPVTQTPVPPPVTATATETRTPTRTPTRTGTRTPTGTATATVAATATAPGTLEPTATVARPTSTPALLGVHVVRPGETLWGIAGEWYGGPGCWEFCGHAQWPRVFEANRDRIERPQVIGVGWRLRVPR